MKKVLILITSGFLLLSNSEARTSNSTLGKSSVSTYSGGDQKALKKRKKQLNKREHDLKVEEKTVNQKIKLDKKEAKLNKRDKKLQKKKINLN